MAFGIHKETPHFREFTGGGAQNAAATTSYAPINGTTNYNATERNRQTVIPRACRVQNLTIVTGTSQPGTGTMVFTIRKNGVDTALTVTVGANAAAGTFSDNTNSVAFAAGDLISLKSVNNAGTNAAELTAWSIRTI